MSTEYPEIGSCSSRVLDVEITDLTEDEPLSQQARSPVPPAAPRHSARLQGTSIPSSSRVHPEASIHASAFPFSSPYSANTDVAAYLERAFNLWQGLCESSSGSDFGYSNHQSSINTCLNGIH